MANNLQDTVKLNNGIEIPWIGLGVFKVQDGEEVVSAVKAAIKNGYRSIDTAAVYGNEEGVGKAIGESLKENGLSREELFITSKVWNADQGYESTLAAYKNSLNKLGLDYLDLYLIHWPVKGKYKETWRALETIYNEKMVRSIGVSNFHVHHLEDLLQDSEIIPAIDQVEFHPRLAQKDLRKFCKDKGIQFEAWAPLMQGHLFDNAILKSIAEKHGKSIAQVIIRWDLQNGVVTIPKSIKEHRIIENSSVFDFNLTREDLEQIDSLNEDRRVGSDPDNFNF
ncbi:aldo/keto reductase [Clostridium akagii]|uniref:aldo/keto reductase n=1 Tax=Clostridium akagii TaxID=91623 RepID=UPI00047969BE|nr:aldo/keto reductase [Clostridium akagii]